MSRSARPRFSPSICDGNGSEACLPLAFESSNNDLAWMPLIWCPAGFPLELFEVAVSQLIHHPEYNSTLILRSETVSDTTSSFPPEAPLLRNLIPTRNVHRKLLPRRPGRDVGLEQYCTLYASAHGDPSPSTLVLTPLVEPGGSLPYYHPTVFHLAFRYIPVEPAICRIEVIPLPSTPTDANSRLYRTCLALLETLHRYGWGAMTNYKKRVLHDCIIPREPYQDLYLVMRERHKHLVDTWQEVTDPLKHVFEDIGIATFLMLLWKDMYGTEQGSTESNTQVAYEDEPWKTWPRPPNGFLDLGCGNGLLVHILTAEGYEGYGIDLRARTSWSHYPETTQSQLRVEALDPTVLADPSVSELPPYLRAGTFIIGNHADELTPWVPVLSTLCSASGYLSIPCCAWTFDARYERSSTPSYPVPDANFVESLNLGGDGSNTSSYSMYRIWLASLSFHCGWKVECETLRIPSTRNWAIIGRTKTYGSTEEVHRVRQRVEKIVRSVREREMFRTRQPEGKAGEH